MIALVKALRGIYYFRKRKGYRTVGFVFKQKYAPEKAYQSIRFLCKESKESSYLEYALSVIAENWTLPKYEKPDFLWVILKSLYLILLSLPNVLSFFEKKKRSPNVFSCLRNKLIPQADGKVDSVAREGLLVFIYSRVKCWSQLYVRAENFFGNRSEKVKS